MRQLDLFNRLPTEPRTVREILGIPSPRIEQDALYGHPAQVGTFASPTPAPTLHTITKRTPDLKVWCGPGALAAITGKPAEDCYHAIATRRAETGLRHGQPIKGVYLAEIGPALSRMGVSNTLYECQHRPTLAQWLRTRDHASRYIVMVTRHFIAVAGHLWTDNQRVSPQRLSLLPYLRRRVLGFVEVI